MWKLIDYETRYTYSGIDEDTDKYFKLRNIEEANVKWVDECDYIKMKRLGLIKA